MPNNTYKSAAVPFVNQKGERSMKRVKVERYVAGKRPAYAKDEDEEFYTTDDEADLEEEEEQSDEEGETQFSDQDEATKPTAGPSSSTVQDKVEPRLLDHGEVDESDDEDEEEDDDPRFRKLRQIESKSISSQLIDVQTRSRTDLSREERKVVVDEDEEEEDIKQRHAIARARAIEEPIGLQNVLGDFDDQADLKFELERPETNRIKREETEDILKDFKPSGIRSSLIKVREESRIGESIKDMLEKAKEEAIITAQLHRKIQEDNKREAELESISKNDFGTNDMTAVNTDDDDDEMAYEEWKLREIQRVLRDRSERVLEGKVR